MQDYFKYLLTQEPIMRGGFSKYISWTGQAKVWGNNWRVFSTRISFNALDNIRNPDFFNFLNLVILIRHQFASWNMPFEQ